MGSTDTGMIGPCEMYSEFKSAIQHMICKLIDTSCEGVNVKNTFDEK